MLAPAASCAISSNPNRTAFFSRESLKAIFVVHKSSHLLGLQATMLITGRDQFGNDIVRGGEADLFRVSIRSPLVATDVIAVTVVDTDDGRYTARWSPGKTGEYMIEVIFGDGVHDKVQNFTSDLTAATPEMYEVRAPHGTIMRHLFCNFPHDKLYCTSAESSFQSEKVSIL